ncbi:exodeoxyribonuclease III [Aeromicrobium sp. CF4.19]|uniref:exodeoxyribonuclease III n=1 Tax=Aeromicrobium sp. CF4.19 TaxID=3373082 RepID=UPI003EE7DA46
MLRIATVNVNGIRAALRKGMGDWLTESDPDVVTLQEVRAPDDILRELVEPLGYHVVHTEAEAKGRAGVAVLSRSEPVAHRVGGGDDYFDTSGRWIESDLRLPDGSLLTVVSAYVHSGELGAPKQDDKYRFLEQASTRLDAIAGLADHGLLTGDLNIGHTERDIRNWKGNRNKAGFLLEERAYLDRFVGELGWVDVHRALAGDVDGPYTWWSMRGQAFDNDTGWRIDYQIATPALAAAAGSATVDRAASWGERWSDHAPLVIDYGI